MISRRLRIGLNSRRKLHLKSRSKLWKTIPSLQAPTTTSSRRAKIKRFKFMNCKTELNNCKRSFKMRRIQMQSKLLLLNTCRSNRLKLYAKEPHSLKSLLLVRLSLLSCQTLLFLQTERSLPTTTSLQRCSQR